jgi:hypothetical protein
MIRYCSALLLLFLSGCAFQQPLLKATPSGYPEGIVAGRPLEEIKSAIIAGCTKHKLQIFETRADQVVCGRAASGAEALFARTATGNSYAGSSEIRVRFTLYTSADGVIITANQWLETQMPFRALKKKDLTTNDVTNDIQQFLFDIGAK